MSQLPTLQQLEARRGLARQQTVEEVTPEMVDAFLQEGTTPERFQQQQQGEAADALLRQQAARRPSSTTTRELESFRDTLRRLRDETPLRTRLKEEGLHLPEGITPSDVLNTTTQEIREHIYRLETLGVEPSESALELAIQASHRRKFGPQGTLGGLDAERAWEASGEARSFREAIREVPTEFAGGLLTQFAAEPAAWIAETVLGSPEAADQIRRQAAELPLTGSVRERTPGTGVERAASVAGSFGEFVGMAIDPRLILSVGVTTQAFRALGLLRPIGREVTRVAGGRGVMPLRPRTAGGQFLPVATATPTRIRGERGLFSSLPGRTQARLSQWIARRLRGRGVEGRMATRIARWTTRSAVEGARDGVALGMYGSLGDEMTPLEGVLFGFVGGALIMGGITGTSGFWRGIKEGIFANVDPNQARVSLGLARGERLSEAKVRKAYQKKMADAAGDAAKQETATSAASRLLVEVVQKAKNKQRAPVGPLSAPRAAQDVTAPARIGRVTELPFRRRLQKARAAAEKKGLDTKAIEKEVRDLGEPEPIAALYQGNPEAEWYAMNYLESLRRRAKPPVDPHTRNQIDAVTGVRPRGDTREVSQSALLKHKLRRMSVSARQGYKAGLDTGMERVRELQASTKAAREKRRSLFKTAKELLGRTMPRALARQIADAKTDLNFERAATALVGAFQTQRRRLAEVELGSAVKRLRKRKLTRDEAEFVESLIGEFDFSGLPKLKHLQKISEMAQRLRAVDQGAARELGEAVDEIAFNSDMLARLGAVGNRRFSDLSTEEIFGLADDLGELLVSIKNRNKLIAGEKAQAIAEGARVATENLKNVSPIAQRSGDPRRRSWLFSLGVSLQSTNRVRTSLMGRAGDLIDQVFNTRVVAGQEVHLGLASRAARRLESVMEKHGVTTSQVNQLRATQNEELVRAAGFNIPMTRGEQMLFVATAANPGGRKAFIDQGWVRKRFQDSDPPIRFETPELLDEFVLHLSNRFTSFERELMGEMIQFNRGLGPAMNRVSERVLGRAVATDPFYTFPLIRRTGDQIELPSNASWGQQVRRRLENMGIVQERVGGREPLVIDDIFSSYQRYTDDASRFIGLTEPLRDAHMLIGNRDFRTLIRSRYGEEFIDQLRQTLSATAGFRDTAKGLSEQAASFLTRNIARVKLGLKGTVYINNRHGGYHLLLDELNPTEQVAAYRELIASNFDALTGGLHNKRARTRWLRELMTHPYLDYRWNRVRLDRLGDLNFADVPGGVPRSPGAESWKRFLNSFFIPLRHAEKMNAVNLYTALRKSGWSKKKAIDYVARKTRDTQNPVTPLEESPFTSAAKRSPLISVLLPFMSQPNMIRNQLAKTIVDYHFAPAGVAKKRAAEQVKRTLGVVALSTANVQAGWWFFRNVSQGFKGPEDARNERQALDTVIESVGLAGDYAIPGFGRVLNTTFRETQGRYTTSPVIAHQEMERITRGVGRTLRALDRSQPSDERLLAGAKGVGDALEALNTLFLGVPIEGPQRYGAGLLRWMQEEEQKLQDYPGQGFQSFEGF